jgi:ferric-dicitrate binding protein FerR (iron transport regulator)
MSAPEPPDVARLREALARLADEPGWPEADAERVFSALHGDVSAEERRAVIDELIRNPKAAEAWRLARELEPPDRAGRRLMPAPMTWMAIAATVAIVAGAAWLFVPWRSGTPVFRTGESRTIASLLPDDARLSRAAPVLRWTPVEGARYRVRVLTAELDLLDESDDLSAPEYRLSEDVLRKIPGGSRILWQIEARAGGAAVVVSPTFSVQLE